jgi:signal transduction histidine kinase
MLIKGKTNASYWLIFTSITLFNSYVIYIVGLSTSFTLYYITLVAFIFMTAWKISAKIYYVLGMFVLFLIAAYCSINHGVLVLDDFKTIGLNVFNTLMCGTVLMDIVVNYETNTNQSEKELRNIYSSKERMFSIIAHDLKGPIGSLAGIAEILELNLEKDPENKNNIKYASTIAKTSNDTSILLENLLFWANNQQGELNIEPINIQSIFESCVQLHNVQIEQKSLSIQFGHKKELYCLGDEKTIFTVLRNLVSNAIKFTKLQGEIGFSVTEGVDYHTYEIYDTGIGMTQEMINEVFLVNSKKIRLGTNNENGTGLGLVLCKELIEKNNGKIWLESHENKGTHVFLQLLVAKELN